MSTPTELSVETEPKQNTAVQNAAVSPENLQPRVNLKRMSRPQMLALAAKLEAAKIEARNKERDKGKQELSTATQNDQIKMLRMAPSNQSLMDNANERATKLGTRPKNFHLLSSSPPPPPASKLRYSSSSAQFMLFKSAQAVEALPQTNKLRPSTSNGATRIFQAACISAGMTRKPEKALRAENFIDQPELGPKLDLLDKRWIEEGTRFTDRLDQLDGEIILLDTFLFEKLDKPQHGTMYNFGSTFLICHIVPTEKEPYINAICRKLYLGRECDLKMIVRLTTEQIGEFRRKWTSAKPYALQRMKNVRVEIKFGESKKFHSCAFQEHLYRFLNAIQHRTQLDLKFDRANGINAYQHDTCLCIKRQTQYGTDKNRYFVGGHMFIPLVKDGKEVILIDEICDIHINLVESSSGPFHRFSFINEKDRTNFHKECKHGSSIPILKEVKMETRCI